MYFIIYFLITIGLLILSQRFLTSDKKLKLFQKWIIIVVSTILFALLFHFQTIESINIFTNFNFDKLNFVLAGLDSCFINILVIFLFLKFTKNIKKNIFYYLLLIINLSIFMELGVFNFRHYESLLYSKNQIVLNVDKTHNMKKIDTDTYEITNKNNYVEFKGINKVTKFIFVNALSNKESFTSNISIIDSGNENYYGLDSRVMYNKINQSKYAKLNLSGKTKSIRITFDYSKENSNDNIIHISNVVVNPIKPIFFSLDRIIIIFCILLIIYLFNPKSKLYSYKLLCEDKKNKIFNIVSIICLLIFQIFLFYKLTNLNSFFVEPFTTNQQQYQKLTESFDNKRLDIDFQVNDVLKNLKNPYDATARELAMTKSNEGYFWDYSFYNNKYYVYFGVVPALLAYYPVYKITNTHLKNSVLIFILLIIISITILLLLRLLIKKYFKNISTLHYIILSFFCINSSFLLYVAKRPDLYSVPIVFGLCLSLMGIYLWASSVKENKLNHIKLTLGSLCLALVAGCRPQLLISSFFCFPIFYSYFKQKKKISTRLFDFICFALPYILVAAGLMYYNYLRFNSPFDFGATYNLTTNDMTQRGIKIDRAPLGLFYFLISPTNYNLAFPFITPVKIVTQYMGTTISEPFYGGLIYNNLLLLFGLFSFKLKKIINNKKLYHLTIFCNLSAIFVILVDTQMAGILPRYILDFSWLLFISTIIVLLAIFNKLESSSNSKFNVKYYFNVMFLILISFSILYNFTLIPVDFDINLLQMDPDKYYNLFYLIQFWL